jgi:hypothetical protein
MGFVTRVCENREALIEAAGDLAQGIAGLGTAHRSGCQGGDQLQPDNGVYPGRLAYVAQKNAAALPVRVICDGSRQRIHGKA